MTSLPPSVERCRLLAVDRDIDALAALAEIVPSEFDLLTATSAEQGASCSRLTGSTRFSSNSACRTRAGSTFCAGCATDRGRLSGSS